MKKLMTAATLALFAACGSTTNTTDAGLAYDNSAKILDYLEGKTMTMQGDDIPTYPNGFNENVNFGASTQCYHSTKITTTGANFAVSTVLGQLNSLDGGAVGVGSVGKCDRTAVGNTVAFTSNTLVVDKVQGNAECFDILASYTGFAQEGRGKISADGKTVTLELFFKDRTIGHSCADGAVGSSTVKFASTDGGATPAFTGNALQVYRIP
jgi:hypothetical protein